VINFRSPYLNTRLDVKYVGDRECVRCHREIADSYAQHPMGRSLAPITTAIASSVKSGEPGHFEADGLRYSVESKDGRLFHRESRRSAGGTLVADHSVEVQFVLGSGSQAKSYLFERDGFVFLSPVTWYSRVGRWDLSPGYENRNLHFGRPVVDECLYCHANRVENVADTVNRYEPPTFRGHAIGCERCHGPGELHVARPATLEGRDVTIVNPGVLEPGLRDSVCEQCHLAGLDKVSRLDHRNIDFRPGMPFHEFWVVLTATGPGANKFVGQVEQMRESRCFRESSGRLGCISCHDPHRQPTPEDKGAYFQSRCLECHADRGCSLPKPDRLARNREDDCVACHMPTLRSSDVFHGTTTDHRVPRGGTPAPSDRPAPLERHPAGAGANGLLELFHSDRMDDRERALAQREMGIALARYRERPESAAAALPLLETAVSERPDDVAAWESRGVALSRMKKYDAARAAFERALSLEPNRETTLAEAAELADETGQHASAAGYWRRLLTISPLRPVYHVQFANSLFHARNWQEAAAECRAALRLSPADLAARHLLIRCELRLKNQAAALQEFKTLLDFDPPDRADLLRQFAPLAGALGVGR
jgi:Tfp pilus assembly protein PilF